MYVREAEQRDLPELLELYSYLHETTVPRVDEALEAIWNGILGDLNHHIIVACSDETLISSCVLVIVPNLTRGQRPYALIENVVTRPEHRGQGCATAVLNYARQLAADERCYKIMLMTGSKEDSTLRLYECAGYNRTDKTAFVQWLW